MSRTATLAAPTPGLLRAHATLLVLTLINLLNYLDRYVIAGMLPLVQQEFGRNDAQMGVLSSSFLVVYALASPVTGFYGDRLPRKWFVGGGVLVWSAATVWSGLAGSFNELLLARALIGVGEAGYAAVAPGMISDLYDVKRRGRMLSFFYAALPVGSALGFTLGGAIGQHYGWRNAFLVAGVPGLALGLLALFMREPPRGASDEGAQHVGAVGLRAILRTLAKTRSFVVNTAGYTAATFAMGGLAAWWPTFLFRERGVPLDRAGFLFGAVLVVAGFLGTIAGGWLGDRIHGRHQGGYFLASGAGLLLATPAGLVAVLGGSPALYWTATFLALFFLFFNTGPLNAAICNVVPANMRASAIAVNVLVIHMLGDALSPWLIGRVSDLSDLGTGIALNCGAIALAGVILVAGAGVLRRDMETIAAGRSPAAR
ncbi:spinster family MFS transporter [Vulgatibacter sp.]|uniref:spinster family MFS transporter n=1 Tax=Vulgatibacter sp. TaxID=1971226 RepID=UPI0035619150